MLNKNNSHKSNLWLIGISVAILSFSILSYEILLTRVFSVILTYHYAFAIVSSPILGLGIGGILLRYWQKWFPSPSFNVATAIFGLFICLSIGTIIKLPLASILLTTDVQLWFYFPAAIIPFIFAGITMADIFKNYPQQSSILYGFDLIGATAGTICTVILLDIINVVETIMIIAVAAGISGLFFSFACKKTRTVNIISITLALSFFILTKFGIVGTDVPIAPNLEKDLYRILNNSQDKAEIVDTRWSAFGRTDLVRTENRGNNEMLLFIDGAAGTSMYNFDSVRSGGELRSFLMNNDGEYFPFYFLKNNEKDNALVIGPGGGKDIVVALLGGVKSITGVEVNPDIVQIVKEYEHFNGGIYTRFTNVTVIVQEGRNYLRSVNEKYDLIMLALPITKSSRSAEGYALTENYIFTIESFKEYLNHLTPEGSIVLVAHSDYEIYRLITLALTAFKEISVDESDAMKHMYTIASWKTPTLIIRKRQFTPQEIDTIAVMIHHLGYDKGNFYLPYIHPNAATDSILPEIPVNYKNLDQYLAAISAGAVRTEEIISSASLNIHPVTDDSPFFYKFEKGLPKPFGSFFALLFMIIGFCSILFIKEYKSAKSQQTGENSIINRTPLLIFLGIFFLLGMGFMLIEISLLQKLMLYIGQPTMALTVLLFSLLLGMGFGSFSSKYITKNLERAIIGASLVIIPISLVYNSYLSNIFSLPFDPKLTAVIILLPLGFVLGIPFPLAIRLMQQYKLEEHVDWMWGINGIASMVGSILSIVIGMFFGFSYAIISGVCTYASIAIIMYSFLSRRLRIK